jgi:cytochrome P450
MMRDTPRVDVDFASAAFKRNPFEVLAQLRADKPVVRFRATGPAGGNRDAYAIARYDDVSALIKDQRFVKDQTNAGLPPMRIPGFMRPLTRNMLALDNPDHARLKKLVMAAFTPKRVEAMRESTANTSKLLLDKLAHRQHFDLIADYALPLPVTVISDLLGVPKNDQAKFARWSNSLIHAGRSNVSTVMSLPGIILFLRYLKYLIGLKRAKPQDDLVSALVAAEADGESLNHEELMAMIAILLSAGHETTVNLIGNGMHTLLTHPQLWRNCAPTPELCQQLLKNCCALQAPLPP